MSNRRDREVSILVPVFNTGPVVAATLDSALAEAASCNAEVMVLDDGSSDDSWQVLQAYAGRVQLMQQKNAGVSSARNRLAAASSGRWLLFLDADDILQQGTVEKRLACGVESSADAVYCDWQRFRETDGQRVCAAVEGRDLATVNADPVLALFSGFWSPPGAWMIRRELHQRIGGFRADLPVIQDARYALDAALSGARFAHARHLGLHYREGRPTSLSQRNAVAFALDCLLHAEQIEHIFSTGNRLGQQERCALASTFEYAARTLAAAGDKRAQRAWMAICRQALPPSLWVRSIGWLAPVLGWRLAFAIATTLASTRARLPWAS